jgi:general stress protein CsbA
METLLNALDFTSALNDRGITLASLGAAYLVFLASCFVTAALYSAARKHLVVAPNSQSRNYALYVIAVLLTLIVATALENELSRTAVPTLRYVAYPQILFLIAAHVWIAYRTEPWTIQLGASSLFASALVAAAAAAATDSFRIAHGVMLGVILVLLAFLWYSSISTKRAFVSAASIYVRSKENLDAAPKPQKPWLGVPHCAALVAASVALAIANSLLRGRGIEDIPAVDVATESGLLMLATLFVCAVPATTYWIARKAWMPELTRFAWLAWIVVGFAFTYGNYLTNLAKT